MKNENLKITFLTKNLNATNIETHATCELKALADMFQKYEVSYV